MPALSDTAKYQALRDAREKDRQKKAQRNIKKHNTGKNKKQAAETIKSAKNLAKNASPLKMLSLFSQINFLSDWMYGLAFMAAIAKDVIDFLTLTGVGYFVSVIATILISLFIAMMMLLGGFSNGTGGAQRKIIKSWLVLGGGTIAEFLPGVDFLPIETLSIFFIYSLLLSDRKEAKAEREKESKTFKQQKATV